MLLTETEQTEVVEPDKTTKSTKKTKVGKTKPKRIKVKLEDKLHTINGLKKVIEGRGKFKQVYHFVDGADKLAYKKYPAKKLSKELFNNGIKICINPDTKELSFKVHCIYAEVMQGLFRKEVKSWIDVSYFSIKQFGILEAQAKASAMYDLKMQEAFVLKVKDSFIPDSCMFKDYYKHKTDFLKVKQEIRLGAKTQSFIDSVKIQECPADASYLEGHWFQEASEGNPFVGFKIKHKETSKVGQFPLSFGLMPAFIASIRWLEKQNKLK
jgi:hypothetical protein